MKRYNRLYGLPAIKVIVRLAVCLAWMVCASSSAMASGSIEHTVRYNYADLTVSDVEAEDGAVYSEISMPEMGNTGDMGAPSLPVHHICFLVPSYSTDFRVTLLSGGEEKSITLPNELIPVQDIEYMNSAGALFTSPDREKYSSSSDEVEVRVEGENFFEGWQHFVTVSIRPVTYNSTARQIVCYNDIQVRLDYRECTAAEMPSPPVFPPEPRYSPLLTEFVVNPPISDISGANRASSSYQSVNDRYIIVTTEDLKADFEKLAVWKRQKGYTAEVVTMESILSTPGYAVNPADSIWDEAAALRKWLKWRYQKDGHYFLLLAGDSRAELFPIRKYFYKVKSKYDKTDKYGENVIPSDVYFADFSKEANDLSIFPYGLYSQQIVKYPSLAIPVGRLMCQNSQEVANYLRKLKLYEAWPGKGDMDYLGRGFVFCQQDGVKRENGTYMAKQTNIFSPLSDMIQHSEMLDTLWVLNFNSRRPTGAQVINAMKDVGLMSWKGHGQPGSIGCAGTNPPSKDSLHFYDSWRYIRPTKYTQQTGLSHMDPNNSLDLLGNIYKPSVAYSISCTIMPFDNWSELVDHNMGSSFTVAGKYGGVALLGNTRDGYWVSSSKQENQFAEILKQTRKIGNAEMACKMSPVTTYGAYLRYTHNLLGDPEFEVWLGVPTTQSFIVSNSSSSYRIMGSNLKGCIISAYDGISNVRCDSITSDVSYANLSVPQSQFPDRLISIWKTGMLPVMKLWADNVKLENVTKTYSLPYIDIQQSGRDVCTYDVSTGATLKLLSATDINAYSAFTLSGGTLYLEGENVKLTGTNTFKGGTLKCSANQLELNGEFVIENCTLQF